MPGLAQVDKSSAKWGLSVSVSMVIAYFSAVFIGSDRYVKVL